MSELRSQLTRISIEEELKKSYMDYAMSVIVGRALPDVCDGLKPVHRRVLYAMYELRNDYNKPYKKSARIVGDVIGKYHPHGDTAVYDAIVRMAQDFSMRYPLVDGQGNFGSVDGDAPAAMRYTEIRMSRFAHAMLADIEKDTVPFAPNYDNTEQCPEVLPTRFPNVLVNGSSGIAVGMATNIPPHNLTEVLDACLHLIDEPEASLEAIMDFVRGPDFPTAAMISGMQGVREAYRTGRGRVWVRARAEIETDSSGKQAIVVHELPYQVNKARLLEKIGQLVKEKRVEGITAIRDESDQRGMRVVVEVRRGEHAEIILNHLYQLTQLQTAFGINMVVLDQGQPRCMGLLPILKAFLKHRQVVVTRRSLYELAKARMRGHLLEGLVVALHNIDPMIELIKASKTPAEAKEGLLAKPWPAASLLSLLGDDRVLCKPEDMMERFGFGEENDTYQLSTAQAQAILDLKLHRLTGLEQDKIVGEFKEIIQQIKALKHILSSHTRLMEVIRDELIELKEQFSDARRTEIIAHQELDDLDFIPDEPVVVTLSHEGYIKNQSLDSYQAQHRGGKGKASMTTKETDFVVRCQVAKMHDTLPCFTSLGRLYWLPVHRIPLVGRTSRGRPVINYLQLQEGETISAILPVREYDERFVLMATQRGIIKKIELKSFSRPRNMGLIAVDLREGDRLIDVAFTQGDQEIMLFSNVGKVIRFSEDEIRALGRQARGVRGMSLQPDQSIVSMIVAHPETVVLAATEKGYGKKTGLDAFRRTARGGQGVIAIQCSQRNGQLVSAIDVAEGDHLLLLSVGGTLVRTPSAEVRTTGRNTQGVRLIHLPKDDTLMGVERLPAELQGQASSEEDGLEASASDAGDAGQSSSSEIVESDAVSEGPAEDGDD